MRIADQAKKEGLSSAVKFEREARGLVVTVVTDDVLFESGSAVLKSQGSRVLSVVGDALVGVPNPVLVEGHTDNSPIATAQYPSNWELSSHRSTSVLRYLVEARGFPSERISSAGYADTKPVSDNETAGGKSENRRVEIVVLAAGD